MARWSDVRRIAMALPMTTEGTSYGYAAWFVNKKHFVWERPLRKADLAALGHAAPKGPIVAVSTPDLEMKDVLIASDPKVFFTMPHFHGYPAVLIRLDKISVTILKDIIIEAWLTRAPKRLAAEFLGPNKGPKKAAKRKRSR